MTSTHKVGAIGAERPYGVLHAKEPGSAFTKCGQRAINWPVFWDRPFHAQLKGACHKCATGVRRRRGEVTADLYATNPASDAQ
ncbi:hypothetical protein [Nocardioides panzhihuensis]|uniref:Uncharacterized protein n=1 Tax=Nocardioides panzhihuensis TaxID=860243 RepID=A0A7Z0DI12_9ACTN|nr:hypothetical protein [Nocardioides panzhihuensis]NYI75848.1 hypothetical protein [Nocardioides panzhihuensis]